MQRSEHDTASLAPQESWDSIHSTMEEARSSMYVAGDAASAVSAAATLAVAAVAAIWIRKSGVL